MPHRLHLDKPVLTFPEFLRESAATVRRLPSIAGIYGFRTVSPSTREELWVAVSAANNCRYCSFVHQDWAGRTGVGEDAICEIERHDFAHLSPRERAAAHFLTEWIANDFHRVSDAVYREFTELHTPGEQRRLKALGRMINLFNRTGNTADALLARVDRDPYLGSRALDEALITGIFAYVNVFILPLLSLRRRESPRRLIQDFAEFSRRFRKRHDERQAERR